MMKRSHEAGFTAVELLITLFVAAAFIIAGSQLYLAIIKDGGSTRAQTTANNLAYVYLREYSPAMGSSCTASATPFPSTSVTVAGLSAVKVKVTTSCPYYSLCSSDYSGSAPCPYKYVTLVQSTVTYNYPQQTITNSVYVSQ